MECDCGHSFTNDEMKAMSRSEINECPECNAELEITRTEDGSMVRLPNSMGIDVVRFVNENHLIELKEAVKELFNRYAYDPEDFELYIQIRLKTKKLEDKYIIDNNFITFER